MFFIVRFDSPSSSYRYLQFSIRKYSSRMNRIDAIRLSKSNEYEKLAPKNRIRDHMNEKAIRVIDKVEQNT